MNRTARVALVAVTQLVLVGAAVAPQLSARLTGDSYVLRVAPLDPIDPFRGAYVTLSYPDLPRRAPGDGTVFVPLRPDDSGSTDAPDGADTTVWTGGRPTSDRPDEGPYLTCDDHGWELRCGIDSWFLPEDEAAEMEARLADGAYAEVRIDGRGHAALVDVRETP